MIPSAKGTKMNLIRRRAVFALLTGISAAFPFAPTAHAITSTWSGGNGSWSSNISPGWNGTGIPNGVGDVIQKTDSTSGTATIDIGPVTIGSMLMGGTSNFAFGVTPSVANPLTFDQDGAGPGVATIANVNPTDGSNIAVVLNAGPVILADDLLINNAGPSVRASGAIIIRSTLESAAPRNVTIQNVTNTFPASTTSYAGAVRLETGVNTFTGNVLVRSGLVTFGTAAPFGDGNQSSHARRSRAGGRHGHFNFDRFGRRESDHRGRGNRRRNDPRIQRRRHESHEFHRANHPERQSDNKFGQHEHDQ
jgi:hypothetical protein